MTTRREFRADHPEYIVGPGRMFVIPEIPDAAPELVREGRRPPPDPGPLRAGVRAVR